MAITQDGHFIRVTSDALAQTISTDTLHIKAILVTAQANASTGVLPALLETPTGTDIMKLLVAAQTSYVIDFGDKPWIVEGLRTNPRDDFFTGPTGVDIILFLA